MPVTPDQPGPYAPASAILEIVNRHRNKGLPKPVNAEVLGRAGISDSLIARTLQALQTLDLIDGDGNPTSVLEGIRLAPEAEYQQRLKEWLTNAYADALQFIDPQTANDSDIRDAFRSYTPIGQQPRMVSLFSGLFRAAGVGSDKPIPAPRATKPRPAAPKPRSQATNARNVRNKPPSGTGTPFNAGGLPLALAGLLASLPPSGESWTKSERDAFVQTFGTVLDFCYPPTARRKAPEPEEVEADDTVE